MIKTRILLCFACYLSIITTYSVTGLSLANNASSKSDSQGIRDYLLFHDYRFKGSSDFASELISTMMDFYLDLGHLVRSYARDRTPENESYNEKSDECYRKLVESAWFLAIRPNLISRLTSVLSNLVDKDTELATRADLCGEYNTECIKHVTFHGRIEIKSYAGTELYNELKINRDFLGKIKQEMDTCLNPNISVDSEEEKIL